MKGKNKGKGKDEGIMEGSEKSFLFFGVIFCKTS